MSKVYLDDSILIDIADAIREKTGESGTITPANMPTEIESISGGEGLNDDFRAFVESSTPELSFTTYTSNGNTIDKRLAGSNLTDINMPNLRNIYAQIPVNNTIAAKLESNSNLYNITATGVLYGSCDKLELIQSLQLSYGSMNGLDCEYLAIPNGIYSGNAYINDSGKKRVVFWPPDAGTITGRSNGLIKSTMNLILTRTASVVTLNSTSASYFNPNISVYVPKSMLDTYKSATNWSTIASQIFAIEDSEVILKGIFNELDRRYNWSGDLTLLQRLQRQGVLKSWQITYNELITIANDLADNGENSDYYPYRNSLIITEGLPIANNVYLYITDTFKYQDVNGDLIPLSGFLSEKSDFYFGLSSEFIPLKQLFGQQSMTGVLISVPGGFGETSLHYKLNNPNGSLFLLLPTTLTNNLVEWKIDNDHTALLAPLSAREITENAVYNPVYDIYSQLAFFTKYGTAVLSGASASGSSWWTRTLNPNIDSQFFTVNNAAQLISVGDSYNNGVLPAFALGKKGVNNG